MEETYGPKHLVVLQHGFLGHAGDVMLLRNILAMEFPTSTLFLCATSNAGETKSVESIDVMGQRLALEVVEYCRGMICCL